MKINIIVYGIRNAPPPCLKQRYGNRQTLPKPEKIKVIEIRYGLQGHFTLSSHVYFINLSKFILHAFCYLGPITRPKLQNASTRAIDLLI